jgi:hypothetical protein
MKNFIYKFAIIIIGLFFLFEITIGKEIKDFQRELKNLTNNQNINNIKEKIKDELKSANEKDKVLSNEDALILKKFFIKISSEIKNAN